MISKPTVVLFMGPAGPGRSSFINKLTGVEGGKAMLGAGPRTQDIKEITMKLRNNQEYVLVDTPGLNDPHRPGGDILQTIADWLEMKYREGILLTGVIYAHDITRQMDGILCESLDIFCCICGDKAAERVRLVSTMWDQVKDRSAAETMVSQLEGNSWKPLLDAGARHMQFNNSEKSAWNIVMDLGVGGQPLLLQQELVDAERNLYETFAGHALYLQLQKLLREELETPKPFWGVPRTRTVRRPMTELEIECRHIEAQLRKARKERQRLEMRHHSYLRQLLSLFSNPIIAIPEVSEIDLVIFVVGPPGADKSWFTKTLSQNEAIQAGEIRHPCTKWHMSASRYNVKDSTNGILVVNTPSFHTDNDFYAERFMTSWLKSRFTKKCRSGVLFLHPLSKNPKDRDIVMQRHLDTFAMRFPNKSMVPSRVYVVPIGSSADAKLGPGQRLSELESVMKSSNSHCGRRWQVSVFPGVFEGQPEIAWSAALLLLKDIAETQANEMPSSRRLTLKGLPLKIPDNRAGLKNLADHLFEGYKKETTNSSLDAKIVLGRVVRDLTPASHPEYISTLIACADLLSERFGKEGRRADLDDAVTLRRNAWTSLPPHDPRWRGTLTELDDYLYKRFRRGSVADLEEIIYLRRTASECASLPDRCRSLVLLANALHERYRTLRVRSDLEEAIKLAHDVLAQNPSDHPDHVLAQKCLADCLQTKLGKGAVCAARAVTDASDPTDIHKVITNIISETVAKMPPRLLHTPTGALCNRDALISHFVNSPAYLELYSLSSPAQIRAKISLFFRFTTLSHRWGVREPLLRDIEGEVIYDLERTEGLAKLQQFCLVSLRHTFSWAWSDTCCIEKNSSAELQEAIGSMFSWYHRSSLTIVYLSDASDAGSLAGSIWFKRGWTLQELLASRTLLFYLQDWSPSMNSDSGNHKTDPTMLEVLQKATGVAARHLEDFSPGMDDPRSKLHWASSRCTTRPEDVAYCLFGIFKVHLPVIYGESAENALGRLLAEIVSQSGDISVLDWVGEASSFHSCFPANLIPYQTVPCTQSIRCDSTRRDSLNFEGARKLYNILAKLPRPRFFHRRLILSSIAYRVVAAKLLENSTSSPGYTYEIHVSHLMPLVVTLSVCLGEDPTTYILIRPWHPKWVGTQTGSEVDATWELLEQLEQPFNALLLMRLPHNEYKRIASNCAITACVQDLRSIADSEILGLEIV